MAGSERYEAVRFSGSELRRDLRRKVPDDAPDLGDSAVAALYETSKRQYFATDGHGVYRYSSSERRFNPSGNPVIAEAFNAGWGSLRTPETAAGPSSEGGLAYEMSNLRTSSPDSQGSGASYASSYHSVRVDGKKGEVQVGGQDPVPENAPDPEGRHAVFVAGRKEYFRDGAKKGDVERFAVSSSGEGRWKRITGDSARLASDALDGAMKFSDAFAKRASKLTKGNYAGALVKGSVAIAPTTAAGLVKQFGSENAGKWSNFAAGLSQAGIAIFYEGKNRSWFVKQSRGQYSMRQSYANATQLLGSLLNVSSTFVPLKAQHTFDASATAINAGASVGQAGVEIWEAGQKNTSHQGTQVEVDLERGWQTQQSRSPLNPAPSHMEVDLEKGLQTRRSQSPLNPAPSHMESYNPSRGESSGAQVGTEQDRAAQLRSARQGKKRATGPAR